MEANETALRRITRAAQRSRDKLAAAGHDVPLALWVAAWAQIIIAALLILYFLYQLALRFDQGAAETDLLL